MAYTVKQLAVMSGVTVRTLHFYDEMALLKPAYTKANGYRIYEEPQLLMLQQILFYRELGFELKRINEILSQRQFEKIAALKSHRQVLEKNVTRTRTLIETIDKTISHLKGTKKMKSEELFMGFSIGAGKDRFNGGFNRYGTTIDCKASGKDTGGAMCVLEVNNTGWPRHVNRDQDEWIYIVDGEVDLEIGKQRFHLGTRESMHPTQRRARVDGSQHPNQDHQCLPTGRQSRGVLSDAGQIQRPAVARAGDCEKLHRRTDRRIEAGVRSPRHDCDWATARP
jgi:DNA-binding transcriptional MerR regulator